MWAYQVSSQAKSEVPSISSYSWSCGGVFLMDNYVLSTCFSRGFLPVLELGRYLSFPPPPPLVSVGANNRSTAIVPDETQSIFVMADGDLTLKEMNDLITNHTVCTCMPVGTISTI